jgi:hypothetical protein
MTPEQSVQHFASLACEAMLARRLSREEARRRFDADVARTAPGVPREQVEAILRDAWAAVQRTERAREHRFADVLMTACIGAAERAVIAWLCDQARDAAAAAIERRDRSAEVHQAALAAMDAARADTDAMHAVARAASVPGVNAANHQHGARMKAAADVVVRRYAAPHGEAHMVAELRSWAEQDVRWMLAEAVRARPLPPHRRATAAARREAMRA